MSRANKLPTTFNFRAHSDDYAVRCGLTRFCDRHYKPLPPSYAEISYSPEEIVDWGKGLSPEQVAAIKERASKAARLLDDHLKHITWHTGFTMMSTGEIIRSARK